MFDSIGKLAHNLEFLGNSESKKRDSEFSRFLEDYDEPDVKSVSQLNEQEEKNTASSEENNDVEQLAAARFTEIDMLPTEQSLQLLRNEQVSTGQELFAMQLLASGHLDQKPTSHEQAGYEEIRNILDKLSFLIDTTKSVQINGESTSSFHAVQAFATYASSGINMGHNAYKSHDKIVVTSASLAAQLKQFEPILKRKLTMVNTEQGKMKLLVREYEVSPEILSQELLPLLMWLKENQKLPTEIIINGQDVTEHLLDKLNGESKHGC